MIDLEECASYIFVAAAVQTKVNQYLTLEDNLLEHKLDKHGVI